MELKVNMNIDEDITTEFKITFLGQTKIIDNKEKSAVFTFKEVGTYDIEFSQQAVDEEFSTMQKIMYLLFLPLMGIFSIFSAFGDSTWSLYKKVQPYLITQTVTLEVNGDMELKISYIPSVYDKKQKNWLEPNLLFSKCSDIGSATIVKNDNAFNNYYLDYKRTFCAATFDVILIFVIIALIALNKGQMQVFFFFSCTVGLCVVCFPISNCID